MRAVSTWRLLPPDPERAKTLARACAVSPLVAQILLNRGLTHPPEAARFLNPTLASLGDPFRLPDMAKAVARLRLAARRRDRVLVFGDSDVDGITAAAIVYELLAISLKIPHVSVSLSKRLEDGYGFPASTIAALRRDGVRLVVLVDCGTNQRDEVEALAAAGIDTVIFDHHVPLTPAQAFALVNPCGEDGAAGGELCSAGLAFKLAQACWPDEPSRWESWLDLAALGTLADYAPLRADSRILATVGLERVAATARPGLRRLCETIGLSRVTADQVLRRLVPCLNAAGRLGNAEPVWRLLTTTSSEEADALVETVTGLHDQTKALHRQMVGEAYAQANRIHFKDQWVMVIGRRGWHPGLMGPLANQLMEHYERPAILLAIDEHGVGVGSGRAPSTVNLVDALRACEELLVRYGGHPQACGLTVDIKQLAVFQARVNQHVGARLGAQPLTRTLEIDGEVSASDLTGAHAMRGLEQLAPFGPGNPKPTVLVRGMALAQQRAGGVHMTDGAVSLFVKTRADGWLTQQRYDLVGTPTVSEDRVIFSLCDARLWREEF